MDGSKPLPHSNFKWIDEEQIAYLSDPHNILADENADTGYIFLVDLIYPDTIKESTKISSPRIWLCDRRYVLPCETVA